MTKTRDPSLLSRMTFWPTLDPVTVLCLVLFLTCLGRFPSRMVTHQSI